MFSNGSKCYPALFPDGLGDITALRKKDPPNLLQWAQHLTRVHIEGEEQNRFAADPRFLLHVTNMHLRLVFSPLVVSYMLSDPYPLQAEGTELGQNIHGSCLHQPYDT